MRSVATPSMRAPANTIRPCVATMPQIARMVVVLPAPLAPSNDTTPHPGTLKSMPCSTRVPP